MDKYLCSIDEELDEKHTILWNEWLGEIEWLSNNGSLTSFDLSGLRRLKDDLDENYTNKKNYWLYRKAKIDNRKAKTDDDELKRGCDHVIDTIIAAQSSMNDMYNFFDMINKKYGEK